MPLLSPSQRRRRNLGLALFVLGVLVGGSLLVGIFVGLPLLAGEFGLLGLMCIGASLAFPAGAAYVGVARLLDRYDPEPWYALLGCLVWGGIAACGFSALINSTVTATAAAFVGTAGGEAIGAIVSAPIVEEFWKGLGVLGIFVFLRHEFDGMIDGVIYATFIALGFATVENVVYYAQAAGTSPDALTMTFVVRGILAPWGHPVYTAMTGLGLGIARETSSASLRWIAPTAGFLCAILLHAIWNGTAVLAENLGEGGGMLVLAMFPVWLTFFLGFVGLVLHLVERRGRIIREHLADEIALATLTSEEVALAGAAFGLLRARLRHGKNGAELVRTAARLALSKWHAGRVYAGGTRSVSIDFVVPLRQRIATLRAAQARPEVR